MNGHARSAPQAAHASSAPPAALLPNNGQQLIHTIK